MKALKDLQFPFGGWKACLAILAVVAVVILVGIPMSHHDTAAADELQQPLHEGRAKPPVWIQVLPFLIVGVLLIALVVLSFTLRYIIIKRRRETQFSQEEGTQMDDNIGKYAPYAGIVILLAALVIGYFSYYAPVVKERDAALAKVEKLKTEVAEKARTIADLNQKVAEFNTAIDGEGGYKAQINEFNTAIDGEGGYKAQVADLQTQLATANAQLAARTTRGGKKGAAAPAEQPAPGGRRGWRGRRY